MIASGNPATPEFVRELHHTLRHLYDPAELRRTPLIELLGVGKSADPIAAVQRALLQAIDALRPQSSVPPHANAWRIYHVLNQRYAGQFDTGDIATNLAISGRQLRRLQTLALQALGDYLWSHYRIEQKVAAADRALAAGSEEARPSGPSIPTREQELGWLRSSGVTEPVAVADAIETALAVAGPLITASGVRLVARLPPSLPAIAANATAMRHALLSVLSAAIHEAGGGTIEIAARARESDVWIDIRPIGDRISDGLTPVPRQNENLEIARQLVTLFGGSLNLAPGAEDDLPFVIRLILPAVEQVPVLVIDDNVDTLRLFERYLIGSRYRFVGVQDPRQAVEVAAEVNPHAIVLDLMLPGVDGWEVLGRLREHPRTRAVPVLVCTILPHEDLALALGAAALIRKPINHQDFLSALSRQTAPIPLPQGRQTSC